MRELPQAGHAWPDGEDLRPVANGGAEHDRAVRARERGKGGTTDANQPRHCRGSYCHGEHAAHGDPPLRLRERGIQPPACAEHYPAHCGTGQELAKNR